MPMIFFVLFFFMSLLKAMDSATEKKEIVNNKSLHLLNKTIING